MIQQRILAGLIVSLPPLLLAGWAMATPLSELGRSSEQGAARGSGYGLSDRQSQRGAERPSLGSGTAGSPSGSFGPDGFTTIGIGFGGSEQDQGFAQDWLRVRSQPDAADDLSALTNFDAPGEPVTEAAEELEVEKISIEELTKLFLEQEAQQGRSWRGGTKQGQSLPSLHIDLGLNLVRKLLDHEVERELAVSALSHTIEIREYLIQLTAVDDTIVFDPAAAQARRGNGYTGTASGGNGRATSKASAEGPQHIAQPGQGSAIDTLTDFIYEYLLDIRIISLTAVSLALIFLISVAVSRSAKA